MEKTFEHETIDEMAQRLYDEEQAESDWCVAGRMGREDRSDWTVKDWRDWIEEETEAATGY